MRALIGEPTGIGVYTLSLLEALAARNEFELVGLAHRAIADDGRLAACGVEVETESAPLGLLWQQFHLPRRLARGDFDLFWSPLLTLPWRTPVPAIVTLHDLTPVSFPETHRAKVRWSVLPWLRRTIDHAARIVTISEATASEIARLFPESEGRVEVVGAGVDPEFRPASPADVAATRTRLGAPGGYILYAGTIEPRKNVAVLLDAWLALRRERAELPPLVLAGPVGWRSDALLARLAALAGQGVLQLGRLPRPELVAVVQAARVFVFPSLAEGFGLPAAEAMAAGVPTIVSTAAALRELAGDAALTVDPEDVAGFAGAIERFLDDPAAASEYARRGHERAQRFRWELVAERMSAIFHEVAATASAAGRA